MEDEIKEPSDLLYQIDGYKIVIKGSQEKNPSFEASVKVKTQDGEKHQVSEEGSNPLESLGLALHKALDAHFPKLARINYDVKVQSYSYQGKDKIKISVIFSDKENEGKTLKIEKEVNINDAYYGAIGTLLDGFYLVVSQLYTKRLTETAEDDG